MFVDRFDLDLESRFSGHFVSNLLACIHGGLAYVVCND